MWGWVPAYPFPKQGNPSQSPSRIFSPAGDRLPENRSLSPESIPRPNGINFASQAVKFGWGSAEFKVSRESVGIRARLPYFKSLWANRNDRSRTDLSVGARESEARSSDGSSRSPDIKHPDLLSLSENWVENSVLVEQIFSLLSNITYPSQKINMVKSADKTRFKNLPPDCGKVYAQNIL